MATGDKLVNLDALKAVHDADAAEVAELKSAIDVLEPAAGATDIGKALIVKTVSGGKVTEYELGETGTQIEIDDTLTQTGEAADAKATGDAIDLVNGKIGYNALANTTTHGGYLNNTKFIYVTSARYRYIIIGITPGDAVKVITSSSTAQIAFLKSYTEPVENELAVFSEETGYTAMITIGANQEKEYVVPNDANYLYILALDNYTEKLPTALYFNGFNVNASLYNNIEALIHSVVETKETANDASTKANLLTKHLPYTMLDEYSTRAGYIPSFTWKYVTSIKYRHIIIPVTAGDKLKIAANQTHTAQVAFLQSDIAAVENATPPYSAQEYYTGLINIPIGYIGEYTVPSDTAYLYVLALDNNNNAVPAAFFVNGINITKTITRIVMDVLADLAPVSQYDNTIGYIQLADIVRTRGAINSINLKWENYSMNNSARYHKVVPVVPGDVIDVIGDSQIDTYIGFLRTYTSPIYGTTAADLSTATGFDALLHINANASFSFVAPSDAQYLYVLVKGSSGECAPQYLAINKAVYTDTVAENISRIHAELNAMTDVHWLAMGDSITQGWYSYYNNNDEPVSATDVSGRTWTYIVARKNRWHLTNIGYGGTGYLKIAGSGVEGTRGYQIARATDFTPYNIVTLGYGIVDWGSEAPMGTINDDASAVDQTTIIGAMKATIEAIIESNPYCKIFVLLPLNSRSRGTWETNWGLGYERPNTGTLETFVQNMIQVCNYYGVQYIDLTHYSCINRNNMEIVLPDQVHPTLDGHVLLARELARKITFS